MKENFDALVQQHQDGKIGWEELVVSGPLCYEYKDWLRETGRVSGELSAKRFLEAYEDDVRCEKVEG